MADTSPRRGALVGAICGALVGAGALWLATAEPSAEHTAQHSAQHGAEHTDHATHQEQAQIWTCSMHPQIQQPEPGQCPICGMDLIPQTSGHGDHGGEGVTLSPRAKALARLRTAEVTRGRPLAATRLQGEITEDEGTLRAVTAWTGGRIHRLSVRTTGARIKRGQIIARLYSPEIFAAHQDLIVARRQVERLAESPATVRQAAEDTLDAAKTRLSLLGLSDRSVERMARQEKPDRYVPIHSPFGGTVLARLVAEGDYVEPGAALYRVADLDALWVELHAYEPDLPRLAPGQRVQIQAEAAPDLEITGAITFIDPVIDPKTRTAAVRVQIDNPEGRLKPGMYVEGVVQSPAGDPTRPPLMIPESAPLLTGDRAVVYVEQPEAERPTYVPRVVRLGAKAGDHYPVLAGLTEGERVVVQGAFVLDADLQIRGGASMMDLQAEAPEAPTVEMSGALRRPLIPVAQRYLDVQRALAADELTAATRAAKALTRALPPAQKAVQAARTVGLAERWAPIEGGLRQHGEALADAADLKAARRQFEGLTAAFTQLLDALGNPLDAPLSVAWCPMAFDNDGARWVQQGDTIDNAYFGASMRRCGEIQHHLGPGDHLQGDPQ